MMMFNRKITTRLSLLYPDKAVSKEAAGEERQDRVCTFKIDDLVWMGPSTLRKREMDFWKSVVLDKILQNIM